MTVPTNNEEAEALAEIIDRHQTVWEHGEASIGNPDYLSCKTCDWTAEDVLDKESERLHLAESILAAGFRRLPVSGDNAEARAEAERRWPRGWDVEEGTFRDGSVNGFILGAEWQASQPREAAPSDTDLESLAHAMYARSIHNAGNGSFAPTFDKLPPESQTLWLADADAILTALSRTSHPVQVEVGDEMVERACFAWASTVSDPATWEWWVRVYPNAAARDRVQMRAALVAALGGGDRAE